MIEVDSWQEVADHLGWTLEGLEHYMVIVAIDALFEHYNKTSDNSGYAKDLEGGK